MENQQANSNERNRARNGVTNWVGYFFKDLDKLNLIIVPGLV